MSSLFDSLNVGLSGLNVAAAGLQTTEHNVANATVAGFTRKIVRTRTNDPSRQGLVWIGQGARVDLIGRAADSLAFGRLLVTTGQAASSNAKLSTLVAFESMFESASGSSLRSSVDGLFDAFRAATVDPADPGARNEVVSAATALADGIKGIAVALSSGVAEQNSAIASSVEPVNADLAIVARLNAQIAGAGGGLAAADLADQRDQAISRLAEAIGATAFFERDGTATIRIGGHAAVSGTSARRVSFVDDRLKLSVDGGVVDLGGEVGGSVGGQASARERLQDWLSDLDTLARDLATAVNDQLALGFDRNGDPGVALFEVPPIGNAAGGIRVNQAVVDDSDLLAFAASATGEAGDGGNLTALIALADAAVVGGRTPGDFATQLTTRVATDTAFVADRASIADAMQADAEELFLSLTGVDLDEEAVRLVQFQAAYQAAAKVVQVADETLDTLMSIVR